MGVSAEITPARLRRPKELHIVPWATHLFEEPGALGQVSQLAKEWFERHLAAEQRENGREP
jgi:putative phosphoribosyl transferase